MDATDPTSMASGERGADQTAADAGRAVAREMPPTKPPGNPLEAEIADMLVRIEINYCREGTGYGSRFEGERLEVVQARAAIRHVRYRDAIEAAR